MNKETGLTHIREKEPENRIHGARTLIKKLKDFQQKNGLLYSIMVYATSRI